ncbi:hypothetical protein A8M56_19180 [Yersinia pestis]|nr:hypothetical protein A8M56_19180 [Yersinia pestis]
MIFPAAEKEVSIRTNNKGVQPALVQVWVDDGKTNANINSMKLPFMVTPLFFASSQVKGRPCE